MNFEALAIEFGVDANALQDLIGFLQRNINRTPETRAQFMTNPEYYTRQGVIAWRDRGTEFFNELLENVTPRAQEYRAMIATQVYEQARANRAQTA